MAKPGPDPNREIDAKAYDYYENKGLSYAETGKLMGVSKQMVIRRIQRHRAYLSENQNGNKLSTDKSKKVLA